MYLYENAIVKDLDNIFKNSKVKTVIADSLEEGLRRSAAENEDKISLPFIVLSGGDWELLDTNFYGLMHGTEFKKTSTSDEQEVNKNITVLPIRPSYTMYIAASSSRECDMLTREVLFHYSKHPTLTVKVPYNLDILHTFNIDFNSNIQKTQRETGLVIRNINIQLQGAYLWHNNTFNIFKETEVAVEERYDENNV